MGNSVPKSDYREWSSSKACTFRTAHCEVGPGMYVPRKYLIDAFETYLFQQSLYDSKFKNSSIRQLEDMAFEYSRMFLPIDDTAGVRIRVASDMLIGIRLNTWPVLDEYKVVNDQWATQHSPYLQMTNIHHTE